MDRALSQSRKYVGSSLGAKYAEPVITLLNVMHSESRPNTPMICFLSMGSDPTPNIEQLAKKLEIVCRSVSMGQGQEVHARRLLQNAKTEVGGEGGEEGYSLLKRDSLLSVYIVPQSEQY